MKTELHTLILLTLILPLVPACLSEEDIDDPIDEPGGDSSQLVANCDGDRSSVGTVIGPLGDMQAVGDSILGFNKEQSSSIPDVVGRELGVSMINNAIGGAEFGGEDGIGTLYAAGSFTHVLVNGGGNDFARECSRTVLDGLISEDLRSGLLVDLVNQITADGAQAVVMGYYLPRDLETGCEFFVDLQQRYRRLGETRDDTLYVCTLGTITPDQPSLYFAPDDPVHPSPAGSQAIGELIATYLQQDG